MACYKPLRGIVLGVQDGKKRIKVVPYDSIETLKPDGSEYQSFTLPCGHCVGCRKDQAKEWSNRLLMESLYHKQNYFVTLTYDNDHAHWCDYVNPRTGQFFDAASKHQATLCKRDIQLFMKRLRRDFPNLKIRFYAAGEYGGHTFRPHYHLVLFGLELDPHELFPCGRSETGDEYFICKSIEAAWTDPDDGKPIGFHSIEPANEYTMKYVANYVTKKIGVNPNKWYFDQGLEPPFNLMSRKPGLGAQYLIDHPEIMDNDRIVIGTERGSYEFAPPRYFKRGYKEVFPDRYDKHVEVITKASEDRVAAIEKKSGLSYTEYLKTPELIAESSLNRRDKV